MGSSLDNACGYKYLGTLYAIDNSASSGFMHRYDHTHHNKT